MPSSSRPASPSSRLALAVVLLGALALAACGRATPGITAEDGRDLESPSGGIWVPEVRRVEDVPARQDVGDPGTDGARATAATATEEAIAVPDTGTDGDADAAGTTGSRRTAERADAPERADGRDREGPGPDGAPSDAGAGDDHGEAEDEPDAPEVVGDCGVRAHGAGPQDDELAAAVDALGERLEEHWPTTHAGAWLVEDEERALVHVGFTEAVGAALEVLCDDFAHPQLLVGVRTELSDAELRELADGIAAERDALRDGEPDDDLPTVIRRTEGRYAVAVDAAANGVRITVEEPSEPLRDAFRQRYTPRLALVAGTLDEDGEVVEDDGQDEPDAEGGRAGTS